VQALCDRDAFTEHYYLKLGLQLVDVITAVLIQVMSTWKFIEGTIIFIQKICVRADEGQHEDCNVTVKKNFL
jgi:hypothetical protein